MKKVFDKIKAVCEVCGTSVDGRYCRGDKYYCASDFEKTSPAELNENIRVEKDYKDFKKIYQ